MSIYISLLSFYAFIIITSLVLHEFIFIYIHVYTLITFAIKRYVLSCDTHIALNDSYAYKLYIYMHTHLNISMIICTIIYLNSSGSSLIEGKVYKEKPKNFTCEDCNKGFVLAVQLLVHKRKFPEGCKNRPLLLLDTNSDSNSNSTDMSISDNANIHVSGPKVSHYCHVYNTNLSDSK